MTAWQDRISRGWVRPAETMEQRERRAARDRDRVRRKVGCILTLSEQHFIAIDGEGGASDAEGRQRYMHLHAASRSGTYDYDRFVEGFDQRVNCERLTTEECLSFILSLPRQTILVGYYIGYDIQHWLRDLSVDKLAQVFDEERRSNSYGQKTYTYWGDFGIAHIPRQYFSVCRTVADPSEKSGRRMVPGSVRTVNEAWGFFQGSFVNTLYMWAPEAIDAIARIDKMKLQRQYFDEMNDDIRKYCAEECRLLAETMERLRAACKATDIVPRSWRGAGHIATALYEREREPIRPDGPPRKRNPRPVRPARDPRFELAALSAYYGGRFEVSRIGDVGLLHEYDINSAYPHALASTCVCPNHTTWRLVKGTKTTRYSFPAKYIAYVAWELPYVLGGAAWGPFPIRRQNGSVIFPLSGQGWYCSPEIEAAKARWKGRLRIGDIWTAEVNCTCDHYAWVRQLYDYRKSIGKATKGYVIKLGLNALAGKKMQRIGGAPYQDWANAALITSETRAMVYLAAMQRPDATCMIATDGVYSREPLDLPLGAALGQWEHNILADGHIVQPGVYWDWQSETRIKSRGLRRAVMHTSRERFGHIFAAWAHWSEGHNPDDIPPVPAPVTMHIGHKLALARGKPELACRWQQFDKFFAYNISSKRETTLGEYFPNTGAGYFQAPPLLGSPELTSVVDNAEITLPQDDDAYLFDGAPDFVPLV